MLELVAIAIILALVFNFLNGFHDSANAISTIVATRVLTPVQAVALASVGNLIGPLVFSVAVATTVGKGIIDSTAIQRAIPAETFLLLLIAALLGAIFWNIATWYLGIPVSSSHALIGGLIGGAIAAVGPSFLLSDGIYKVLAFMVISPLLGFVAAYLFALLVMRAFAKSTPAKINSRFRFLQLFSSFFYSITHGTNDAQKTMGVIAVILLAGGVSTQFEVPFWTIIACQITMALGTLFGGWRIVKTMAFRITSLRPYQGFCAETAGGIVLANMAHLGIPVSITHAIAGAIMGVGTTKSTRSV